MLWRKRDYILYILVYYVIRRVMKIIAIVNFDDRYGFVQISQFFSTVKSVNIIEFN